MAHEKYFLVGAITKAKSSKPHNTIIDNFTMYNTKVEAMNKADQLFNDDKMLEEVKICFVSDLKTKQTSVNVTD